MPTVNVLGWYNKGNVGDESYKLSLPILFPDHNFIHTCDLLTLPHTKTTIMGGGDIVTKYNLQQLRQAKGLKHIVSVTVSDKDLKAKDFDGIDSIFVRDSVSIDRLKEIGVPANYSPDMAFALKPNIVNGREKIEKMFRQQQRDLYSKVVVVVVNDHLTYMTSGRQQTVFDKLAYDLAHVADYTSASFLFIPFGTQMPWDDRISNGWVSNKCKFWQKNLLCYDLLSAQNVLDIIGASDAVISTRLHSSIFSAVSGVPFIDITHNHKNARFLETLGLQDWSVPLDYFDYNKCRNMLEEFFKNSRYKLTLNERINTERRILNETLTYGLSII